jgi:hypothetical protein
MPRKALQIENDLLTRFPAIAAQAHQWDASLVAYASHKSKEWKCEKGHVWVARVCNRTIKGYGCPYCSGRLPIKGVNDLATVYPGIAAEANGWDPSIYTAHSGRRMTWKCVMGHEWRTSVNHRTRGGTGCPYCASKLPIAGQTDLASVFPDIAKEACGWDPSTVLPGSDKKMKWRCSNGHEWMCRVANRTIQGTNCTVCSGKVLASGVNDLLSKFPEIAREAHGWNPAQVRYGSDRKMPWLCPKGHTYIASPNSRTCLHNLSSCPYCATYGYQPSRPAWMYLMEREEDQQIGITNSPKTRLATHERNGWVLVEMLGPSDGAEVFGAETAIKQWLKCNSLRIKGTHENWKKADLMVASLGEIALLAGLDNWDDLWGKMGEP